MSPCRRQQLDKARAAERRNLLRGLGDAARRGSLHVSHVLRSLITPMRNILKKDNVIPEHRHELKWAKQETLLRD